MSSILINDLFEELSEENKRLLNELMFANKCLNILIRFKTFIDLNCDKLKTNLDSNECQKFEELSEDIEEVMKQRTQIRNQLSDYSNLQIIEIFSNHLKTDNQLKTNFNGKSVDGHKPRISSKKTSSEVKQFFCDINECGIRFKSRATLLNHQKIHKKNMENRKRKSFVCEYKSCHFKTVGAIKFKEHMECHKLFKCYYNSCDKPLLSEKELDNHIEEHHLKTSRFSSTPKCHYEGCNYYAHRPSQLDRHLKIHEGVLDPLAVKCCDCARTFYTTRSMERHRSVAHNRVNGIFCRVPGCFTFISGKVGIKEHGYKHNNKLKTMKPTKKYVCGQLKCHFQTDIEMDLEAHHKQHYMQFEHPCPVNGCEHRFETASQLFFHKKGAHPEEPEKQYKCHICGLLFTSTTNIHNHKIKAHSEVVLSCDWPGCDYTTKLKHNLANHKLVHSEDKKHPCDWPGCSKQFKARKGLVEHLRIHTNNKCYACHWPGCQYRCTNGPNLGKHMKQVHKMVPNSISLNK